MPDVKTIIFTSEGGAGHLRAAQQCFHQYPQGEVVIVNITKENWLSFEGYENYRTINMPLALLKTLGFVADDFSKFNFGEQGTQRWNEAQKKGDVATLKSLVSNQPLANSVFAPTFEKKFKELIVKYPKVTQVITTQPIGIGTIYQVISNLNKLPDFKARQISYEIKLTDLLTVEAVHFIQAISALDPNNFNLTKLTIDVGPVPMPVSFPSKTDLHQVVAEHCPILYPQGKLHDNVKIVFSSGPIDSAFINIKDEIKQKGSSSVKSKYRSMPVQLTLTLLAYHSLKKDLPYSEQFKQGQLSNSLIVLPLKIPANAKVMMLMMGSQASVNLTLAVIDKEIEFHKQYAIKEPHWLFVFCGNDECDVLKTNQEPTLQRLSEYSNNAAAYIRCHHKLFYLNKLSGETSVWEDQMIVNAFDQHIKPEKIARTLRDDELKIINETILKRTHQPSLFFRVREKAIEAAKNASLVIIPLTNQSALPISHLYCITDIAMIRPGGLSVMEAASVMSGAVFFMAEANQGVIDPVDCLMVWEKGNAQGLSLLKDNVYILNESGYLAARIQLLTNQANEIESRILDKDIKLITEQPNLRQFLQIISFPWKKKYRQSFLVGCAIYVKSQSKNLITPDPVEVVLNKHMKEMLLYGQIYAYAITLMPSETFLNQLTGPAHHPCAYAVRYTNNLLSTDCFNEEVLQDADQIIAKMDQFKPQALLHTQIFYAEVLNFVDEIVVARMIKAWEGKVTIEGRQIIYHRLLQELQNQTTNKILIQENLNTENTIETASYRSIWDAQTTLVDKVKALFNDYLSGSWFLHPRRSGYSVISKLIEQIDKEKNISPEKLLEILIECKRQWNLKNENPAGSTSRRLQFAIQEIEESLKIGERFIVAVNVGLGHFK